MTQERKNPFIALADAIWSNGEDGEIIARDLAEALKWITSQGAPMRDFHKEIDHLLSYTSQPVE